MGGERSVCVGCGRVLEGRELIPVISFIWQRGRCRGCRGLVSLRYLVVEVIGGVVSGLLFWRWGLSVRYAGTLVVAFMLLLNALTDYG